MIVSNDTIMKLLLLLSLLSANLLAQNKIATYGSLHFDWYEFTFYDDGTFERQQLDKELILNQLSYPFERTKGTYNRIGDTIYISSTIEYTYQHGNISPKYVVLNDSVLVDLDICLDYKKINSLEEVSLAIQQAKSEEAAAFVYFTYSSTLHYLKFPYSAVPSGRRKWAIQTVLKKVFHRKEVTTFFERDPFIYCYFRHQKTIVPPNFFSAPKPIECIHFMMTKKSNPKRIEFQKFVPSESGKEIFVVIMLFGNKHNETTLTYKLLYVKEGLTWINRYCEPIDNGYEY